MKRNYKVTYFALACTVGLIANSPMADAAVVNFSSEQLAADGANIATDGVLHTSVSYTAGAAESRVVNGLEWNARTPGRHTGPLGASEINDRNLISTFYTDPTLKLITDDIIFALNSMTLTINGLTPGQQYRLQFISFDAEVDGESIGQRNRFQNVVPGAGNTGSLDFNQFLDGPGDLFGQDDFRGALVTATWTADAADIDFVMTSTNGNLAPILNAFVVQQVPEPSSVALLGLGGLALMFRRRK